MTTRPPSSAATRPDNAAIFSFIRRKLIFRKLVPVAMVLALALGMTSCEKKTTSQEASDAAKSAGNDAKDAAKDAGAAVNDAAKATGKAVDNAAKATGKAAEDATK